MYLIVGINVNQIYGLNNTKFNSDYHVMENLFTHQLINLALDNAKKGKLTSIVLKDKLNNRGEIAKRGVSAGEKSVIDLCKLTPLAGLPTCKTLLDEVALYRAMTLGFTDEPQSFFKKNKYALFVDYMLACSLCYVEVFRGANKVDKFYATRNRFLVGALTNSTPNETAKYVNHLATYPANYEQNQLVYLKVNFNKSSVKIVQPRKALDLNQSVKITPCFLTTAFVEGIREILSNSLVKFTYIKDNLTEREMVTTTSIRLLNTYYDEDTVKKMVSNMSSEPNRGYERLPEIGLSRYDDSGVRALNLARIVAIEPVTQVDTKYINVDFKRILPTFRNTIEECQNLNIIANLFAELTGMPPSTKNIAELKVKLIQFVEEKFHIGTTTVLRQLHDYMNDRPQIFTTYNGGIRQEYQSYKLSNFNLGLE